MSILRRFLPKVLLVGLLLSVAIFPLVEREAGTAVDPLTPGERAFVAAHGPIRYAPDPLFPPFEFLDSSGVARGITPDLLTVMGRKLGVEFRTVAYPTWSDVLEAVKQGNVDLLGTLTRTPEREGFLLFSRPYLSVPYVLFVRQDGGDPKTIEDMASRRLGVVKNYGINTWLSAEHPNIRPMVVEDTATGLTMVATGQLDALLETLPVGAYIVREKSLTNIRIVPRPIYTLPQHFGVRKGEPLLLSIVQKGLDSLTGAERSEAFVRWTGQDFSRPPPMISPLLRNALLVLVATAVLFGVWIVALRRNVRRATQSLRESEEKFRTIADFTHDWEYWIGPDRSIRYASPSCGQITGYPAEAFAGDPGLLFRIVDPEDRPRFDEHIRDYLDGAKRGDAIGGIEFRIVRSDGEVRWVGHVCRPVFGADGIFQGRRGSNRDVTDRKRAEEALRSSSDTLQALVRSSPLAIVTFDKDGNIGMWNPAAERMFGWRAEEIMGRPHPIVPEDKQDEFRELRESATGGRTFTDMELRRLRKDGSHIDISISTAPLRDAAGSVTSVMSIITDVTERKRTEEEKRNLERQIQQTQKLESLGVLAGGIAHDFNNILMAVLGHAELALEEISPMSPARGSLTGITTAARRAADLCRQMLAYAGKASFALERVGLRDLVEEMAHLLKTAISKKAILNLNLERGLPSIEADPSQIRQVVMNLIINASEAIGDRSGVITVSVGATRCDEEYLRKTELRESLAPGLYVHLEVTDTGGGMDAETRSRIFEPFFSTKFTGRGLGLAAVMGIVRAHKGALKVYSEPGKGTTFKILFPALEDAVEGVRTNDSSPRSDWRGQGTILLVDDEESLIALGSRMLEHLGFTVLTASDGLQAVDLYRKRGKEIDLVLMDLTMPHMDGAEAFGELRRLNPEVRVVLASGYSHEDVAARFAGKGLDGVLQKPYTLLKLRDALAGVLPKRRNGEGVTTSR